MTLFAPRVQAGGFVGSARKPSEIRGLMLHMAEGNNVARYLSGKPARGVSVQFTVELDGTIIPMVPELVVAGSLDPKALRSTTGPYYGRRHLDVVLGKAGAINANRYVIAVEIAGTAKNGPNTKQQAALVRLFRYLRKKYPRIRPLGHRDQQDIKSCPGGSPAMRATFAAMGGHGADWKAPKPKPPKPPVDEPPVMTDDLLIETMQARIDELEDQVDALEAVLDAIRDLAAGVEEP